MAKNGKKAGRAPAGEKPKACYVLSLSVENVRCFGPKQTLDLSDGHGRPAPWTIILGENGSGKTTLLQLMVGFELVPSNGWTDNGAVVKEALMPRFFDRYHWDESWVNNACSNSVEAWASLEYTATSMANGSLVLPATFASIEVGREVGRHDVESPPPFFIAYGVSRRLGSPKLISDTQDDPVGTLFTDNTPLRDAEEWLAQLDYAVSKRDTGYKLHEHRLEIIKTILTTGLLPDVDGFKLVAQGNVYPKARAEFHHGPSGWVTLRQLGYGYQTVIAWVLDFVSRMVEHYPDSPDPLKEPAICVVDEIDLHLHPAWQRKLIGFLSERFPNTQFIATAHSPLVVQAAENANIAVLKREGDHVVIRNDVDDIRNWRVDQILTSDLFGLESARSPEVERLLARNEELLAKAKPTAAERRELKEIEQKIEALPTWADPGERRDLATIKAILERLDKSPK